MSILYEKVESCEFKIIINYSWDCFQKLRSAKYSGLIIHMNLNLQLFHTVSENCHASISSAENFNKNLNMNSN